MSEDWHPRVAAVMCTILGTRRASARSNVVEEVAGCVQSMLANLYEPLEVIVVDQSLTPEVADALHPLADADSRLRYIHSHVPGLTRSQNIAVNSTDAELFVFTDDDCLVPPDWVDNAVAVFRRHPEAGMCWSR